MARTYKIRKFENGRNKSGAAFINYSLTLPTPLAEKLIEQFSDVAFEIELTEAGILYKPVEAAETVPEKLPFKPGKRTAEAPATAKAAAAKPAAKRSSPAKPKASPAKPAAKAKPAPKAAPKAKPAGRAKPSRGGAKPAAPRAPKARPRAKAAA